MVSGFISCITWFCDNFAVLEVEFGATPVATLADSGSTAESSTADGVLEVGKAVAVG